ncbi:LpxI family protein [Jiella avicenniae]|uniref:UDP-2,3-diacylglucosamine diphosphatase LpxI n=1 Tax=Jiella avicenniae TaxID=2907202 RepID=A0A9X1P124_9HYPH|nr:UDP-2,3-diacylglucosamine diphosphatase LpxI [Jiella avicenniae]MCE7027336.1 UDP-2,3-diacylglucosamine diphosphatase LpxI [Jiella avicenniae]
MDPRFPGEPLGLIAGGGRLPRIVAEAARARGFTPIVVRIADAESDDWDGFDGGYFSWGRTGDAIRFLKRKAVARVVTCGTVSRRPDFRSMLPSFATLFLLPTAFRIVRGGDDRLLRNVAVFLKAQGLEPLAVQDVAPKLLAPTGPIAGRRPDAAEERALHLALNAARTLGSLDVGQAVVASQERVIALEAAEGTREMLLRVAELKTRGRIGRGERLVLVKAVKPQQDERFDLPSIGVSTIREAEGAGIGAIGVTAEKSLIIDCEALVTAAGEAGIAVVGLAAGDGDPAAAAPHHHNAPGEGQP